MVTRMEMVRIRAFFTPRGPVISHYDVKPIIEDGEPKFTRSTIEMGIWVINHIRKYTIPLRLGFLLKGAINPKM